MKPGPRSSSELVSWNLENVASELPETKIALSFSLLPLMLITLSWINENQRFWGVPNPGSGILDRRGQDREHLPNNLNRRIPRNGERA